MAMPATTGKAAFPKAATPAPLPQPAPSEAPAQTRRISAKPKPPFRLRFLPGRVELFDLTAAPADALEAVGLEPGFYWLPEPDEIPATKGANGVDAREGWGEKEILAEGYALVEQDTAAKGGVLLGAWTEVHAPFLPEGVPAGGILRPQPVNGGTHYLSPWSTFGTVRPGVTAKPKFNRALYGCWIASLVKQGIVPGADIGVVEEKQAAAVHRVATKEAETQLPDDVRRRRIGEAAARAEPMTTAEVVGV